MKFTSISNMYIGKDRHNKALFIIADDHSDAVDIADKYTDESNCDNFSVKPFPENIDDINDIDFCNDKPLIASLDAIRAYESKPNIVRCSSCKRLINMDKLATIDVPSHRGPGVRYTVCPHCEGICNLQPE